VADTASLLREELFEFWRSTAEDLVAAGLSREEVADSLLVVAVTQHALLAGFSAIPDSMRKIGIVHRVSRIRAEVANLDPEVEWDHQPGAGAPEEGVYKGRESVRSLLGRLREAWDHFHVDVRDVADRGNEFTVNGTIHARGRISDIELEGECEYVIEFQDSKAVRIRFTTRTAPVLARPEKSDAA